MHGKILCALILGSMGVQAIFDTPQLLNPSLASASSAVNGGFEVQGHWGALPPPQANIFSSDWNDSAFKQMYNLNSLNPFAGDRGTGYDAIVRQYAPFRLSNRDFFPISTSFLSDGSPNPYNFDINSPMYKDLYNRYYNFYNTNLNLLKSKMSLRPDNKDLNQDYLRRKNNPQSFEYDKYFDGVPKSDALMAYTPLLQFPSRSAPSFGQPRMLELKNSTQNKAQTIQDLRDHIAHMKNRILELEREELNLPSQRKLKSRKPMRRNAKRYFGRRFSSKKSEYKAAIDALSLNKDPLGQFMI